jgi:hypothetical protein
VKDNMELTLNLVKQSLLLVADPPAGDKLYDRLKNAGHHVEYIRNAHGPDRIIASVTSEFTHVLAMNARSAGKALKDKCRRLGITLLPVPPSWSKAAEVLREAGISVDEAPPLTHKPLAKLKEKAAPPVTSLLVDELIPPLKAVPPPAPAPATVEAPTTPDDVPLAKHEAKVPSWQETAREMLRVRPNTPGRVVLKELRRLFPVDDEQEFWQIRRAVRVEAGITGKRAPSLHKVRRPTRARSTSTVSLPLPVREVVELMLIGPMRDCGVSSLTVTVTPAGVHVAWTGETKVTVSGETKL